MDLLQMSISGAVLIAAIALARLAALRAVPKRTFLVLWAVVLVRLLVPFAPVFAVPVSLPAPDLPTVPTKQVDYTVSVDNTSAFETAADTVLPTAAAPDASAVEYAGRADDAPEAPAARELPQAPTRPVSVWRIVWLAGMALNGAVIAGLYLVNYRRFRRAVPIEDAAAQAWLDAHPLRRRLQIKTLHGIDSPLTYGVLRPMILVPEGFDFADNASRYALEHEYVHARRFDAAFKLALATALAVHWFNPAVLLMYFLANRDIELSCDEAVLRRFGEGERAPYARALLAMEERRSELPALYAPFGANTTRERILAIMKFKKTSVLSLALAAVLVLALAACAATGTNAQNTAEKTTNETDATIIGVAENIGETPQDAGASAARLYVNDGMTLTIPDKYADLLLVETPQDSEWGTLFSVSEKASVEAAEADGYEGAGGLFGIARITRAQLDEMMTEDMSGAEVFAKDADGSCYMYYHPTDVQFYRSGDDYQNDQAGWAQWEVLNDWAWNDVRERFIADNGLTPFTVGNSAIDIFLARLACWDNVRYTISSTVYGPLEPDGVDAAPYVERLRDNVAFEWADPSETPDGEYFVLNFPEDGERFDFFIADNYVREVYGSSGEYQILYRVIYADGTTKASDIMRDWYEALAGAYRLSIELNALQNTLEHPVEDEPMVPKDEQPVEPEWQASNAPQDAVEHFENDGPVDPQAETPAP